MITTDIINRVFPSPLQSLAQLEIAFPSRELADDAAVTRIGTSPTGMMHVGAIYAGMLNSRLKTVATQHGFAARPKDFKKRPDDFKGTVAHVARIFRVLLTGMPNSLDLHSIMQVFERDRVIARISLFDSSLHEWQGG
jgi:hypothetical protein